MTGAYNSLGLQLQRTRHLLLASLGSSIHMANIHIDIYTYGHMHRLKKNLNNNKRITMSRERKFIGSDYWQFFQKPGFNSSHPHGSSQPPVTLVPEDLMPSSGLHRDQAYKCGGTDKSPIHIK